jgi:AcrR family transcriptional regulator
VPRTVDPRAHAVRREAYVEAALRLIQAGGYERLSVQAVIDAVGASKGAFFHYFHSKAELLAAVVERTVETATSTVAPVATDPQLTAIQKLEGVFAGIYQWKSAQPEFQPAAVAELMRTWFSDENTIVVQRMRIAVGQRLTPLFAEILRQGAAEGSFSLPSTPEGTASVLTALSLGLSETAIRLFLGRQDDSVSYETVTCTLAAYFEAIERILGLPPTFWPIVGDEAMRQWFG